MLTRLLFIAGFFTCSTSVPAQPSDNRIPDIADSVPAKEEVRKIPGSFEKIQDLRHMVLRSGTWFFNNKPYSGKYADYYENGQIKAEGSLLYGKQNGPVNFYFMNGIKQSTIHFKNGVRHGDCSDYYKNGQLMQTKYYSTGELAKNFTAYFINGQVKEEMRPKQSTLYDTSVTYFSNGKIRAMAFAKNGLFPADKKQDKLDYYSSMFYQSLNTNNIRSANKYFYEIWLLDSTGIDTHLEEGLLLYKEFRFDLAITAFDKALQTEPYMMEALTYRALALIKKYKYAHLKVADRNRDTPLSAEDMMALPREEQQQACNDILLADTIDAGDYYVKEQVADAILNFCTKNNNE